jgi:hypothetical protein
VCGLIPYKFQELTKLNPVAFVRERTRKNNKHGVCGKGGFKLKMCEKLVDFVVLTELREEHPNKPFKAQRLLQWNHELRTQSVPGDFQVKFPHKK